MARQNPNQKKGFRALEQMLSVGIGIQLALYVLYLIVAGCGIVWLKVILGLLTMAAGVLGCGFLVLIGEHKRPRSRWLLAAFGSMAVCTLVSLIFNYPSPF